MTTFFVFWEEIYVPCWYKLLSCFVSLLITTVSISQLTFYSWPTRLYFITRNRLQFLEGEFLQYDHRLCCLSLLHSRKYFEDRKSVVILSPFSKVIFSHHLVREDAVIDEKVSRYEAVERCHASFVTGAGDFSNEIISRWERYLHCHAVLKIF
jgi:hypothetical protein